MPCPLVFGVAVNPIGFLVVRAGTPNMNLWHWERNTADDTLRGNEQKLGLGLRAIGKAVATKLSRDQTCVADSRNSKAKC
jgi:hypothetical protein